MHRIDTNMQINLLFICPNAFSLRDDNNSSFDRASLILNVILKFFPTFLKYSKTNILYVRQIITPELFCGLRSINFNSKPSIISFNFPLFIS